jgi:hypothetical protein
MIKLADLLNEEVKNNKITCDSCKHSWFKSEGGSDMYMCHICGYDNTPNKDIIEFAKKRLEGATKIVNNAKEKGGYSMLTYHHFVVKLPYYENASKGMFDCQMAKIELKNYIDTFCNLDERVEIDQIEFQKLVGLIEVLGELIIKHRDTNNK